MNKLSLNTEIISRIILLCIFFLNSPNSLTAQPIRFEKPDIRISLTVSQSMADDWRAGVTKTLEAASAMDFRERIHIDTLLLKIQFKYAAGMLYKKDEKNNRETAMPTDNRLFGEGVLTYPIGWKLDPFFSASFNTQITESFRMVGDNREATASLWDPVTSIQSWGFEYSRRKAGDNISSRIGFSLKQNRAFHYTKLTDDRETHDIKERWKTESGIQWKTDITWQIDSSTNYRGTLDLYGSFDDMTKWTVKWTNEFKIKVYAHIGILAKLDLFYDEKQAVYTQYKQALRFGVIADF